MKTFSKAIDLKRSAIFLSLLILLSLISLTSLNAQLLVQNLLWTNPPEYVMDRDFAVSNFGKKVFCMSFAGSVAQVVGMSGPAASKFAAFVDPCWNRLVFLENNYNAIRAYGSPGSGNDQFSNPLDIEVRAPYGGSGTLLTDIPYLIFVADTGNDRVQYLRYFWAQPESGLQHQRYITNALMSQPIAIDIDNDGKYYYVPGYIIWVATADNLLLAFVSADGSLLNSYGGTGSGTGYFDGITGLACGVDFSTAANDGSVFVADSGNERIVRLQRTQGSILWQQEIGYPAVFVKKLEVDGEGNLWIVHKDGQIHKYTKDFVYLGQTGSAGTGSNQLDAPTSLSCGAGHRRNGGMMVCERWGDETGIKGFTIGTSVKDSYADSYSMGSECHTDLKFTLGDYSFVTAAIFSSTGAFVKTIADNLVLPPGVNTLGWDGKSASGTTVASGIYFAEITAEASYENYFTGQPSAIVTDTAWFATCDATCTWLVGDADNSGAYSIGDSVYLINYIFGGGPAPQPHPVGSGDADCSGDVGISDPVYLINFMFGGGPAPQCTCEDYL